MCVAVGVFASAIRRGGFNLLPVLAPAASPTAPPSRCWVEEARDSLVVRSGRQTLKSLTPLVKRCGSGADGGSGGGS